MNIYRQSLEEIQAGSSTRVDSFDPLPGVPDLITARDTASIFSVSVQTIERMIAGGDLRQTPEGKVIKKSMADYILCHTLADLPVLDDR